MLNKRGRVGALAALVLAAACGGGRRRGQVLTVYSPHGREMLEAFEKRFEARTPAWTCSGGHGVAGGLRPHSLRARQPAGRRVVGRARADLRAGRGRLAAGALRPHLGRRAPGGREDPQGLWHGNYLTPEVIAYNSAADPRRPGPAGLGRRAGPEVEGQGAHPRPHGQRHHAHHLRHGHRPLAPRHRRHRAGLSVAAPAGRADARSTS